MNHVTREIDKETYDKAIAYDGKHIPPEMEMDFFGAPILQGYGLYGHHVYEKDGKYYCSMNIGSSCD